MDQATLQTEEDAQVIEDLAREVGPTESRKQRWMRLLSQFLFGQVAIQAINMAVGLLLLRWLSVTAYAQYSVAFAFQITLGMLINLGFSNSIVALVGHRGGEPEVVGRYLRSAQHFRKRLFLLLAAGSAIAFPVITARQPWSPGIKLGLFAAIITTVFFQGRIMYSAPLLINQRIKLYYNSQFTAALVRTFSCFFLHLTGGLTSWVAAGLGSLSMFINGALYQRYARPYYREPAQSDPPTNLEMRRYIAPLAPSIIFTAFQGQIAVGVITFFGQTQNIADMAALGRLGQLFVIFSAFNSVIIEPFVARVTREQILKRYLQIAFGAASLCAFIAVFAFSFPQPFVWLLGEKYWRLKPHVGWMILATCIEYFGTVLWTMNFTRKYLYWAYTAAYIASVLSTQIICGFLLDLSQTRNVLYFLLTTNIVVVITHALCGFFGIRRELRREPPAQPPA